MKSESELARIVSQWLRSDGWRTYHEVPVEDGRCDILAVQGPLVWAIETKLRQSLEVLHQAMDRRASLSVHGVLIAVPRSKSSYKMARLCKALGLGLISVSSTVTIDVWPDFYKKAKTAGLLASLSTIQETQEAGTTGRRYWTPFKETAREFLQTLRKQGRLSLKEAADLTCVAKYKGSRAGASARRRWLVWAIQADAIPGCRVEGRGRHKEVVFDPSLLQPERAQDLRV